MTDRVPAVDPAGSSISHHRPLVFMHIPKTGGMSLFTAFTALWGTAIADLYDVSARNAGLAVKAIADHSKVLYCGHYAYGLHGWFDRPVYYAAVLREPITRLVSLYHYCQPMLNHYRKRLQQVGGNMAQLAAQPRISDFYLDFGPWLKGEPSAEAFFASPSAELDNGMVRRFSGYGLNPAPCPAAALEQAQQNIEQSFSVVGLLERYPETLQLMASTFRLPALAQNQVNANRKEAVEKALDPALMQKLRDMNPLDLALYDWVCARFDTRLTQPRPAIAMPGGGRQDAAAMPLWRSVGQSPRREAAMKEGGVPQRTKPSEFLFCNRLTWAGYNAKAIMTDVDTVVVREGQKREPGPRTRLVLDPATAKRMATALTAGVAEYEKKHGPIPVG